jgi:hypothetical protein
MLKIMWVDAGTFLWNFGEETPSDVQSLSASLQAALSDWASQFRDAYRKWLDDEPDASSILHDIRSSLHSKGQILRDKLADETGQAVYYWFDVDRSEQENFQWEYCPLCSLPLTETSNANPNDRLVCERSKLVFPG